MQRILAHCLLNYLLQDPESRCRSLGFCATDNVIRDPVREATPSRKPVSTPVTRVAASPQCILCEFVMKEIDDLLSKNATEVFAILLYLSCSWQLFYLQNLGNRKSPLVQALQTS